MKKRIISLALTLCMVFTLMPTAVSAAEVESETTTVTSATESTTAATAEATTAATTTAVATTPTTAGTTIADTTVAETTVDTTKVSTTTASKPEVPSVTDVTSAAGTEATGTTATAGTTTAATVKTSATTAPAAPETVTPTDVTTQTDITAPGTGSGVFNAGKAENPTSKITTPKITSATDIDAVEKAQLLINSLPDGENITESNLENVENHLDAIDEALSKLTAGERATLNFGKYNAAIEAIEALYGMEGASVPSLTATAPAADTSWYTSNPTAKSYTITTEAQLIGFRELVNGGNHFSDVTITLGSNITLTADWTPIGSNYISGNCFSGIFDGNGKTISNMNINWFENGHHTGLFSYIKNATIKNLNVSGSISNNRALCGGIVGYATSSSIAGCTFSGSVTSTNESPTGGIAGQADSCNIENCYNAGTISGVKLTGGIVGSHNSGNLKNCYNTGSVSDPSGDFGGIAGKIDYATAINCHSYCLSVPLYGDKTAANFSNSYYLSTTSSGEQKTAAEFSSGEIAYLLQNGQSGQIWGQNIGTDNYPVLTTNSSKKVYRVTFSVDGTETYAYVNNGKTVAKPSPDPTKTGDYVFAGWYKGDTKYAFTENVTSDITLTAKFARSEVSTEDELKTAIEAGITSIKLTSDINLTSNLNLSSKNITIDLNGHVISGSSIYINTGLANASLTLTDSNPTATHSDDTLPKGGVVASTISMKQDSGSYHECTLYANGGTVTSSFYTNTQAVSINCTNNTPTAFKGNISGYATLKGGIYYGSINSSVKTGTNKTVEFIVDSKTYAKEFVAAGKKAVAPIEPTKTGMDFTGWHEVSGTDAVEWDFDDAVNGNITLTAIWEDIEAPKVTGLEAGKTYCSTPVKFKVTDNVGVASVEFGSDILVSDSDGYYYVTEEMGWGVLVAKDAAGNTTYVDDVTINDGHVLDLKENSTQFWYECSYCDYETAKYNIPTFDIVISGSDQVCRGQDYVYSFELPDDYYDVGGYGEFAMIVADNTKVEIKNGVATVTIYASGYADSENAFDAIAVVNFEVDKNNHFDYSIRARKPVKIVDSHIDLRHVERKPATKSSEGNIEYWYCAHCGKYYSDKELTNEITRKQTVIAKLKQTDNGTGELTPKTGDTNPAPWLGVMFISAAVMVALADYERRRKLHREK